MNVSLLELVQDAMLGREDLLEVAYSGLLPWGECFSEVRLSERGQGVWAYDPKHSTSASVVFRPGTLDTLFDVSYRCGGELGEFTMGRDGQSHWDWVV